MKGKYNWLSILLLVAALGLSAALYSRLPETVPSHWNIRGEVDGYAPRALAALLMPGIMAGTLLLSWTLLWISPRNYRLQASGEAYFYIIFCVMALLGYMHALMLWAGFGHVAVDRAILGGMFVFFALIGNVLGRIKRNFWTGIKTLWTLASETVWYKTHRFGGKVYVGMGIAGLILTAAGLSFAALMSFMLVAALAPCAYSYFVSRSESEDPKPASRRVC